jgi:hypothetical protein
MGPEEAMVVTTEFVVTEGLEVVGIQSKTLGVTARFLSIDGGMEDLEYKEGAGEGRPRLPLKLPQTPRNGVTSSLAGSMMWS